MFWGTYQPQLYFGLQTRSKTNSIKFGLMWNPGVYRSDIRHQTREHGNIKYRWLKHDGMNFGKELIEDVEGNIEIESEFVKFRNEENEGNWIVKVKGRKLNENIKSNSKICLFFYMYIEDNDMEKSGNYLRVKNKVSLKGIKGPIIVKGNEVSTIGEFTVFIKESKESKEKYFFTGNIFEKKDLWKVDKIVENQFIEKYKKTITKLQRKGGDEVVNPKVLLTLDNKINKKGANNLIVFQKIINVQPKFEFDIVFMNKKNDRNIERYVFDEIINNKVSKMFKKYEDLFDEKFENIFELKKKKYNDLFIKFGMFCLSNLVGGIGYFHGDSNNLLINDGGENKIVRNVETHFSSVPSRSKFPRPFLWDEGFHLEIILKWNKEIGKDILMHWFSVMSDNGWIPREQILGDEGRSRVPLKFQQQNSKFANPPTLFIAIENNLLRSETQTIEVDEIGVIRDKIESSDLKFLSLIYPKMKKNYEWYINSQKLKGDKFAFQWYGRTENHTLASGFDDYPRGTIFPSRNERHLDLYCWLYMITKTMKKVSKLLKKNDDFLKFEKIERQFVDNLYRVHYDKSNKLFADYVGEKNTNWTGKNGFSNHIGYVTLLPFISEIIQEYDSIIDMIIDTDILNSDYGLRSLSISDDLYQGGENYWRGKIWINMNYLTLKTLKKYPKYRVIYQDLRKKIIKNVFKNYQKKKTIFENFDPENGDGRGTSNFTGWSSLVLLIISQKY